MTAALPRHEVRFRIDRTRRLDAAIDRGALDLAVHLAEASSADGVLIGAWPPISPIGSQHVDVDVPGERDPSREYSGTVWPGSTRMNRSAPD